MSAGNADGGQWTGGGYAGAALGDEEGDQELLPSDAQPVQGHHYEPKGVLNKFPLSSEARHVLMKDVTGPLQAERHGWSGPHKIYNEAVEEHFKRFFHENKINPEEMTADQARKLSNEIKNSKDPRIRDFNMRIWMREIIRFLRRGR